jgi:hypothetical protein
MLCKQLVHVYDVELGSILKYIESCFNNLFEKCLSTITFHNKNMKLWEHFGLLYYRCQCILNYFRVHYFSTMFHLMMFNKNWLCDIFSSLFNI